MFRVLVLFLFASTATAYGADFVGSFSPKNVDFGEIYQYGTISVDVDLKNTSQNALDISRIDSARPDVVPSISDKHVKPGDSVQLKAEFPTLDRVGSVSFHLDIFTASNKTPDTRIVLRGFVDWIVDPVSTRVDLGIVNAREGAEMLVPIAVRPGEELKLVSIEKQGRFVSARISDDGSAIKISTSSEIPWGIYSDKIYALTDNPKQPKVAFVVDADIRGDVVPSANPIDIGVVDAEQGFQERVRLDGPQGKKLQIGKLVVDGEYVEAAVSECLPKLESCAYVDLRAKSLPEKTMNVSGVLEIELPDYDRILPIPFSAMIVKSGTVVRNLNDEMANAKNAPASISSVLKTSTIRPVEMPRPGGVGPLLSWEVANEWGVYGYEIYRSMSESGPFGRVNDKIVRRVAERDQAAGSIYHWRDLAAIPGKAYWYKIQIVYESGKKQGLSSPQRVVANGPRD